MIISQDDFIRKIHLLISIIIAVPTSLLYGVNSDLKFELYPESIDELNFFKAIMGLYLGFSILWLVGIFKTNLWKTAAISNTIFMLGLGSGRLLSIFLDGIPTDGYVFGTIGELCLGFYGIWVLKR